MMQLFCYTTSEYDKTALSYKCGQMKSEKNATKINDNKILCFCQLT